jgi:hypothetical protein
MYSKLSSLVSEKYYGKKPIKASRRIHTIIFAYFFPLSGIYSDETERRFFLKGKNLLKKN